MSTWAISFTTNFLNTLFMLPEQVRDKFTHVVNILENNPHSNGHSVKIRGYEKIFRIYVTRKYRLFYTYGDGWVKLLNLLERDKDTYKAKNLDRIAEEAIPPVFKDEGDVVIEPVESEKLLSEAQLKHWYIPKEYHDELLQINRNNEDKLLDLNIPLVYIERIIDNLYPKTLKEIQHKAEFELENQEDLQKFVKGEITEFLLKLSDEQKKLLEFESDVPILVKGGPGTGKSTLALHRVKKLVKLGVKKILFTTHNLALSNSSKEQLYTLLGKEPEKAGVEVKTVDELAEYYYTKKYGKPNIADEKFCLFCLESAINIVNNKLERRLQRKIAELGDKYLLEEILIVIEARGIESIDKYRDVPRFGRRYDLKKRERDAIWLIYETWQELISYAGLITREQLRRKALEIALEMTAKPYSAVIIDEAQDLSPVALKFLVNLASSNQSSNQRLYLTADVEQSLYQRSFGWDYIQASIDFKGETQILRRSFRNTEQIGKACPEILLSMEIDYFSKLQGDQPKIVLTDDLKKQTEYIKKFLEQAAEKDKLPVHCGAILSPNIDLGKLMAQQLSYNGLPAEYIEARKLRITKNCVKVMSLHSAKGLEFPFVVVIGLKEGMLPKQIGDLPKDERKEVLEQERKLFYVGCSRAMRSLLVCGSKSHPSQFLKALTSNNYWQIEEI